MGFGICGKNLGAYVLAIFLAVPAAAAGCGKTAAGFEQWKSRFAVEAKANGIRSRGISAVMAAKYSTATIRADRGQKSFKLSLKQFMQKRGAAAIVAQGKRLKRANAALFTAIEKKHGVPAGPLIAIWGMETAFGGQTGNQNTVSAVATLAYDCRRPEFFTDQLYAMLELIDRGVLSENSKGAMHGEVGQTQFLPKSVSLYGTDGDGDGKINLSGKADALASTANFLKAHGWVRGVAYQPGDENFAAIQGWNAASVYQRAIAIIASQIDEG